MTSLVHVYIGQTALCPAAAERQELVSACHQSILSHAVRLPAAKPRQQTTGCASQQQQLLHLWTLACLLAS